MRACDSHGRNPDGRTHGSKSGVVRSRLYQSRRPSDAGSGTLRRATSREGYMCTVYAPCGLP
eukprot:1331976-Amorphochlora_amoeboformis.AAC.1